MAYRPLFPPRSTDRPRPAGFTLTEFLTVIGLIALIASLLLPVIGRVRTTAASTACLANLRQIGTAWTMSVSEDRGRLTEYVWNTPETPEVAWNGYWTGVVEKQKVKLSAALCPAATAPPSSGASRGYGTASNAWSGRYCPNGTAIRYNDAVFRESSYGYNRYLSPGRGAGMGGNVTFLSAVQNPSNVPAFFDCAFLDAEPRNGAPDSPAPPPPDLSGNALMPGVPEHWKFTLARHGRGINVYMADGSATWVRLEDLYMLTWKAGWEPYRLPLPAN
jgi:prepilin-type N-terminal cleavage/methylation domain-containing protein/prepilin-type processing-associated H-X9-DG protein